MIRAQGLAKYFGGTLIVSDITFRVGRGERIALVGEDGRARRAMLRILGTMMPPSAGRLEIGGVDALQYPLRVRSHIMWAGAAFCVGAHTKAGEYLRFIASVRGARLRDAGEVSAALTRCGIASDELVDGLPEAKRRLLDLTSIALVRPPLFFWEDVTQPPVAESDLWRDLLRDIAAAGTTIVCTTQAEGAVATICDRSVCIDRSVQRESAPLEYAVGAR